MTGAFSWEKEYKKTWLSEKESTTENNQIINKYAYTNKKKGILRHLHILIDMSNSIDKNDFIPCIRTNYINCLDSFISEYLLENPISGLSFSIVNEKNMESTNNTNIKELLSKKGEGYFSLLNGLYTSVEYLKKYTFCKEILVLTSSLVLKDPDSYTDILEEIRSLGIKISIISICGELIIYKKITEYAGGKLYVPLNLDHFNYLLKKFAVPGDLEAATINLVKLGFPNAIYEKGVCACHYKMHQSGYECPACKTYICSLPVECPICESQLVSSLNITKSFHHMYPLKPFPSINEGECIVCCKVATCYCDVCKSKYCLQCDLFIHENLNFCIVCAK